MEEAAIFHPARVCNEKNFLVPVYPLRESEMKSNMTSASRAVIGHNYRNEVEEGDVKLYITSKRYCIASHAVCETPQIVQKEHILHQEGLSFKRSKYFPRRKTPSSDSRIPAQALHRLYATLSAIRQSNRFSLFK